MGRIKSEESPDIHIHVSRDSAASIFGDAIVITENCEEQVTPSNVRSVDIKMGNITISGGGAFSMFGRACVIKK